LFERAELPVKIRCDLQDVNRPPCHRFSISRVRDRSRKWIAHISLLWQYHAFAHDHEG
jgi:hypothetical protein